MTDLGRRHVKSPIRAQAQYVDRTVTDSSSATEAAQQIVLSESVPQVEYRVYKRRWFGLIQLILLNIIVSWDV